MKELKELIVKEIKSIPEVEVGLSFSGGVTSLFLLFACLEAGKKVTCYIWQMKNFFNADSKSAIDISEKLKLPYKLIKCSIDSDSIYNDILLLRGLGCNKRYHYEYSYPYLYLFPELQDRIVISGIGSEMVHGFGELALNKWNVKAEKSNFDKYRHWRLYSNNLYGVDSIKGILKDKNIVFPFLSQDIFNYFLGFDWQELNLPTSRIHLLRSFREQFNLIGVRKRLNYSEVVNSFFNNILLSKYNINQRTKLIDFYDDLAKGLI